MSNPLDKKACCEILPKLQNELENIYINRLSRLEQLKNDEVYKKIMQRKDAFVNDDHFDLEKAIYIQALVAPHYIVNMHIFMTIPITSVAHTSLCILITRYLSAC